jgi:hypothetical protein
MDLDWIQWYAVFLAAFYMYHIGNGMQRGKLDINAALAFIMVMLPLFLRIWHLI